MSNYRKITVAFLIACGVFLIVAGFSHATNPKIDQSFTQTWKKDWNRFNPGYKFIGLACWKLTGPYENCLFVEHRTRDNKDLCGELTVDTKYKVSFDGVNRAPEGVKQYTCITVKAGIKLYGGTRFVA